MSEAAASAQSATKRKARGEAKANTSRRQSAPAGTIVPTLDDETAAALTLFNTYLVAHREQQAHERALKKAEKAKDEAAAAVRELNDKKASASETAAAEAAYREAADALRRLRDGDQAAPQDASDEAEDEADDGEAPAADTEEEAPAADVEASTEEEAPTAGGEEAAEAQEPESVGVEASVGDDDLAGDEPAGVAG